MSRPAQDLAGLPAELRGLTPRRVPPEMWDAPLAWQYLGLCFCYSFGSPAAICAMWRPELVVVDDFIQVTHSGIFREYKIEYTCPLAATQGKTCR